MFHNIHFIFLFFSFSFDKKELKELMTDCIKYLTVVNYNNIKAPNCDNEIIAKYTSLCQKSPRTPEF